MELKHGHVTLVPETMDDFWHLYNILEANDKVYAKTTRIQKVEESYSRPKKGKRVSVFLGLTVRKVQWDRALNRLRIHGIVFEAPEHINAMGSHHTINVNIDKPINITKTRWLKNQVDRLKRASRPTRSPIIMISIDDEEYCVAFLRQYGVDVKVEEKTKLPGKLEAQKRAGAKNEYFKRVLSSLSAIWKKNQSSIVVIGPGFIKNEFLNYLKTMAPDLGRKVVDVKGVNAAGVAGIQEVLRSGVLTKALKHIRIAEEAQVVEETLERIGKERRDVSYGFNDVMEASIYGAVEKLLLADSTLRDAQDKKRSALENLAKKVEEKRGKIIIISTEHEAGAKLLSLGGIAALLRFPFS